jgi:hypothetical protein
MRTSSFSIHSFNSGLPHLDAMLCLLSFANVASAYLHRLTYLSLARAYRGVRCRLDGLVGIALAGVRTVTEY